MQVFQLTVQQMLMMFFLMAIGYVLRKKSILPENANTTMSRLETYVFIPALSLYTQMTKCTVETFQQHSGLLLYGLVIALCCVAASYPLSALFVRNASQSPQQDYQRRIYQYAMTFSNYGFMGNFIILGVWGNDMYFQYSLFNFFLTILCYTFGLYILIPKEKNAGMLKNLKKGIFSPPVLAMAAGIAIGLLDWSRFVPEFILSGLNKTSACQGPVAMLLAGFVIGGYNFKELILNQKVYVASIFRLILIPAVILIVLRLLGASQTIRILALIAFGTPLGLNTIVYPSAYGGDPKTGASMAMISQVLSVATIPLMYLVFIELM